MTNENSYLSTLRHVVPDSVRLRSVRRIVELSVVTALLCTTITTNAAEILDAEFLMNLRDLDCLSLSPDGSALLTQERRALVEENDYEIIWRIIELRPGVTVTSIGDGGDVTLRKLVTGIPHGVIDAAECAWSPDSNWVAYRASGSSGNHLRISSRDAKEQRQIFERIHETGSFVWSMDSSKLIYSTNSPGAASSATNGEESKRGFLFDERFNPIDNEARPRFQMDENDPLVAHRPIVDKEVRVFDLTENIDRLATGQEKKEFASNSTKAHGSDQKRFYRRSKDGEAVGWFEAMDSNKQGRRPPLTAVASFSDATGTRNSVCRAETCRGRFEEAWWDGRGHEFFMVRQEGHGLREIAIYAWEPRSGSVRSVLKTDGVLSGCKSDRSIAYCFYETPLLPQSIVGIDLDSGLISTIYAPNEALERALADFSVQSLNWSDAYGNPAYGHLVTRKAIESTPQPLVIVQYRSRGFLRGGIGDEYPILPLASLGFAVLRYSKPEDRDLWATTENVVDIAIREWAELYTVKRSLSALQTIISRLSADHMIDRKRVGITALSAGNNVKDYGLVHTDLFATAISSGGSWAPSSYYLLSLTNQRLNAKRGFGQPFTESGKNWSEISLAMNVDRVNAPILINAPDSEYLQDVETVSVFLANEKPIEMYVFPNEYHVKWQPVHRYNIYRRNIQWLQFWLQGAEVDDPVDPEQYVRWRKMRAKHCDALKTHEHGELPLYCEAA